MDLFVGSRRPPPLTRRGGGARRARAGVALRYRAQPVEETFFRMSRFREFDAAELSLSSYVVGLTRDAPFIAVPVFPSRLFRHSGIYVSADSGIEKPGDLVGKRVGVAEYQLTANVWIRGILADQHDVPVESVTYRTGGLQPPTAPRRSPCSCPRVCGWSRSAPAR